MITTTTTTTIIIIIMKRRGGGYFVADGGRRGRGYVPRVGPGSSLLQESGARGRHEGATRGAKEAGKREMLEHSNEASIYASSLLINTLCNYTRRFFPRKYGHFDGKSVQLGNFVTYIRVCNCSIKETRPAL
jgi:hypothetical protein